MSFVSRLANSWDLFKKSVSVMRSHPKLLAFPLIIFVLTLGILLFFLAPVVFQPTGYRITEEAHWEAVANSVVTRDSLERIESATPEERQGMRPSLTPQAMGYLAVVYLASMFLATFFATAFYHEILSALRGGGVSISGGLRFATTKLHAILLWSLFAGLVGILIRMLEERVGVIGRWVVRLIGIAWSIASVFAIPVIVSEEETNPIEILKRSATTLKRTWGESLTGFLGIQLSGVLVLLATIALFAVAMFVTAFLQSPWIMVGLGILWLLCLFALLYILGVANNIYRCALYLFAAEGQVPGHFDRESMDLAWKVKGR
jgi:hypothetical protein